jgi:hypothetical protein
MGNPDEAFIIQIENTLQKEGFGRLNIDQAADAVEAIKGFIEDLSFNGWVPEVLGYGG